MKRMVLALLAAAILQAVAAHAVDAQDAEGKYQAMPCIAAATSNAQGLARVSGHPWVCPLPYLRYCTNGALEATRS